MQLEKQILNAFKSHFKVAARSAKIIRRDGEESEEFDVSIATHRFSKSEPVVGEISQTVTCLLVLHSELAALDFPFPPTETDEILDRGIRKTVSRIETLDFGDTIFAYKLWVDS